MTTLTTTYIGPAAVLASNQTGGQIEVQLPSGGQTSARVALAIPYSPAVGDEVLVIGDDLEDLYVIGVLHGGGVSRLTVPGDLAIEAPNGAIMFSSAKKLELTSRQAVETSAPQVTLRANRLNLIARRTIQKFDSAFTWVAELLQVKSRRIRTVADEGSLLKADRMHVLTKGNCVIKSKTIHLG
jgi:hypothetical protein